MTWWGILLARICPQRRDASDEVQAAFDRMTTARADFAEAALETARSARAHAARIEAERIRIRARTAEADQKWPSGKTSDARRLVEQTLQDMDRRKGEGSC